MMTVKARGGYYQVIVANRKGLESFFITKTDGQVRCTCGKRNCVHLKAVKVYLEAGGEPTKTSDPEEVRKQLGLQKCPVCGGPLLKSWGLTWRCGDGGNAHYFQWLDESRGGAIKKWMCGEGKKAWKKTIGLV